MSQDKVYVRLYDICVILVITATLWMFNSRYGPAASSWIPFRHYRFGTTYELPALQEPANCLVVWMHGLGDSGKQWASTASSFQDLLPRCIFLYPSAGVQPTIWRSGKKDGEYMKSWYNFREIDANPDNIDPRGLDKSVQFVKELVEQSGIPAKNTVLAGFSQGGPVALKLGLSDNYAGVLALSTWYPFSVTKPTSTPVFWAHGKKDRVIPFDIGQVASVGLQTSGVPVTFHAYDRLRHSWDRNKEQKDVQAFLTKVLGKTSSSRRIDEQFMPNDDGFDFDQDDEQFLSENGGSPGSDHLDGQALGPGKRDDQDRFDDNN